VAETRPAGWRRGGVNTRSRPLTILHLAAPGVAGGLESVVLELTSGLRLSGHRVVLAAVLERGTEDHPVTRRAAEEGVEVRRLEVPPRAYLMEYRLLRQAIADVRPDVIHTHGYRADLIGGLAARRAGVPWVSTVHGFTGGDRKNRIYEWLQVRAYRRVQSVVAVSEAIRERLMREGIPAARIHLLPNAWAPKSMWSRENARRRLGIVDGDPVIGWVGRLTREKGADVFLEALALLPNRHWRACIVGDGRERPALAARALALGIADRVAWQGLVHDAAALYPAFDTWVLSSRTEGTPIALFEAMAARVPAIVTAVGGVPDVVSAAEALLVPPERPDALAAAIAAVLADPAAADARVEAAYRRLAEAYAPADWLAAHVALYRSAGFTRPDGA